MDGEVGFNRFHTFQPGNGLALSADLVNQIDLLGFEPGKDAPVGDFLNLRRCHGAALDDHGDEHVENVENQLFRLFTDFWRHRLKG